MKALLLGDRFMTNEVLTECFEAAFKDYPEKIEIVYHSDNWPVEPVDRNEEICEFCGDDTEIINLIKDVDILLTHTGCITRRVIDAAERLKVIGVGRGGPVNINVKACTEKGIPVMYAPGRNSGAVAEFTVGLMLAVTRNIAACHRSFYADKRWRGDMYAYSYIGDELSHSVAGLIGFGAIGSKVTKILRAFGSRVLVYDPYIDEESGKQYDCQLTDLDTLLKESDIISLHARYTAETYKMIGAAEIEKMKKTAYLINTARGELIDHDALYEALKTGRLAGAALDVFEDEPPAETSELFKLDNVVACTHLGGASRQAAVIGATKACEGIFQVITGQKPEFCANKEV
ncbi:MAG TPA: 2-hydroxyacid dehydrogenase, partial [Anaerovoracaceae bacterium]|nr:2-hydroxyacid dehydrogenase [Anaerovoracaceae bacterium]